MTDKKPPVIEGEIVDKTKEPAKTKKPDQFITEQTVIIGVVAVVLIVVGYFGYPYIRDWALTSPAEEPVNTTTEVVEENTELQDRVAALEAELAGLETADNDTAIPADLEARIAALETSLAQIPAEGGGPVQEDPRIAEMAAEIYALKTTIENIAAAQGSYSPGYSTALAELAPPLYKSQPFVGELEQVRIFILEMPALDQATLSGPVGVLSTYAKAGIVSMPRLREEFTTAMLQAFRVEGLSPDAGWWDRTWAKIKGQVVIRNTDGTGASTLEAVISEAEGYLAIGEVGKAYDLIAALPAGQSLVFENWLALAGQRAKALAAFEVLTNYISSQTRANSSGE